MLPAALREKEGFMGISNGEGISSPRVALVFCVHHKPWLIMSSLITTALQDEVRADFYFLYQVGDGSCPDKAGYGEYRRLMKEKGRQHFQLSSFDERVRKACKVNRHRFFELELENDQALDSGAWYKFIRSGRWQAYDYVLFLGEGTLFTRSNALSSMLRFADWQKAHIIASGHEKRRLSKRLVLSMSTHEHPPTPLNRLHDAMVAEAFQLFCRDPEFKRLFDNWPETENTETQHHTPDLVGRNRLLNRLRLIAESRSDPGLGVKGWLRHALMKQRGLFTKWDLLRARMNLDAPRQLDAAGWICVNGKRRPLKEVTPTSVTDENVRFHSEGAPEWFGCATNHLMSRAFLKRLSERLEHFQLYDVLDLPFSGSALEVLWGFFPAWLGFEKWFTDGLHRVRKNFVTYRREDDPEGMASYINRYYCGHVAVGWKQDHLRIIAASRVDSQRLREVLPPVYFK
ncbi:MAG: hypothetical protein HYU33_02000 [Candidatus Omnitrophica bacterium]|nr:hypothetical protein [Candidatus Omnitrophota bacterium]